MTSYLITGGTGTFARAFIKCILPTAKRVVAYARHEKEMHEWEKELGSPPNARFYLGDVRDLGRLEMALEGIDTIIHTAALKRIEQCERDPFECKRTNIDGTENVIRAALRSGVTRAILLSTDKAVAPVNVYGASKQMAEALFLAANNISGGKCAFGVVRYGNIWGSRGSVVPTWIDDLALGKTIKITDPECTRFYMTLNQAVDLVLDTLATMKGGELVIPSLPAYRLGDLALAMGVKAMKVTGLNGYEKRHETMGTVSSDNVRRMTMDELREALEMPWK